MLKSKKSQFALRDSRRGLITANNPKSPITEQYRTIRTNIQFSMIDKELKVLACTSSKPGEGKSTTIANLAVTFANQDEKVLLIDADLRKPTLHQIMRVKNHFGLTTLLTQRSSSEQPMTSPISKVKKIDNLYILPSGPIPPNPSELLGSKAMEKLILELSKHYDWILFDTPPVLAVTDAQILGSRCDGVIFVLRSHQTEKKRTSKS